MRENMHNLGEMWGGGVVEGGAGTEPAATGSCCISVSIVDPGSRPEPQPTACLGPGPELLLPLLPMCFVPQAGTRAGARAAAQGKWWWGRTCDRQVARSWGANGGEDEVAWGRCQGTSCGSKAERAK